MVHFRCVGAVAGERFVHGVEAAIYDNIPFICFAASGGARMQEGLISLMQMAKTSAALARLAAFNLPYVSILTDPTMGGVSASLAMLGDIIILCFTSNFGPTYSRDGILLALGATKQI